MRVVSFSLLLIALAACTRAPQPEPQTPLGRAAAFLWKQQAEDGGWHSRTYGLLKSGQSATPFVLDALLKVPAADYQTPQDKVDKAIAFIRSQTNKDGALGMMDPTVPDYPNYSTALAVRALIAAHTPDAQSQVAALIAYLRTQQFTEPNRWHPKDAAYGAWGMGGGRRLPPDTGHVDLSMSRYVIEAFRAAGIGPSDPALKSARTFIERCQNYDPKHPDDLDGGFFFSTTEFDTNKAGHDGNHFRSYGTTTADGILALLAVGADINDTRIVAAARWLTAHHNGIRTPGFEGEAYHRWIQGLAYYYSAASVEAFRALGKGPAPGVAADLQQLQKPDGSWANTENLVKEDDPLIATGFAIRALIESK